MEESSFPEKRIIHWSHPRSVSTAFELVFEERDDTKILHEPCARLRHGKSIQKYCPDPAFATRESTKRNVFRLLLGPHEKPVLFIKDMAYYLRKKFYDALLPHLTNTFIIRNPEEALISHYNKYPKFTFEQAGYAAIEQLHEYVTDVLQQPSIIIDGNDFRNYPSSIMGQYCENIGLSFDDRTLHWKPGNLKGWEIWQRQGWHKEAEQSTGVRPQPTREPDINILPRRVKNMIPECRRIYEKLFALRIQPKYDRRSFNTDDVA